MRIPFTMDSQGFLHRLDLLERRFDGVVRAAPLSFAGVDDDPDKPVIRPHEDDVPMCAGVGDASGADAGDETGRDGVSAACDAGVPRAARWDAGVRSGAYRAEMVDETIARLAVELFGATGWASLVCVASLGFDAALVEQARRFMARCSMIVASQGLAVWLYDLINDATMSMLLERTSPRMPVTIRPMSRMQMTRWLHGGGRKRLGSAQQRAADRAEYGNQAHRLAAYCMLRWGAPSDTAAEIAAMLLTNPGIGMCMLREDRNVRAQGACTDTRYRRVVDYLRRIRAQADLDYAQAVGRGDVPEPDPDARPERTVDIDRRYLHDARRLVEAYRGLWDRPTRSPGQMLMEIEELRLIPEEPLWENPVYLRDLADSLMGTSSAADLVLGFEERDEERFARGVETLEALCGHVEAMTMLTLPVTVLDEREPDWDDVAARGYKERTRRWRAFCDLADDVATIVLYRLRLEEDGEFRPRAAASVIAQCPEDYCEMVLPLFSREIERLMRLERAEGTGMCGPRDFEGEADAMRVDVAA